MHIRDIATVVPILIGRHIFQVTSLHLSLPLILADSEIVEVPLLLAQVSSILSQLWSSILMLMILDDIHSYKYNIQWKSRAPIDVADALRLLGRGRAFQSASTYPARPVSNKVETYTTLLNSRESICRPLISNTFLAFVLVITYLVRALSDSGSSRSRVRRRSARTSHGRRITFLPSSGGLSGILG